MNDDIDVRPLTPADARGVSHCLARCYGDSYPKRIMYESDRLAALVRSGAYGGVVAVAGTDVVGHIGFSRPASASTVVEAGTTIVDPGRRGAGLMGRMGQELGTLLASAGAAAFIHFPTTAHPVMQRASLAAGGRETGIMLAYLPPDARDRAIGGPRAGRLAVTVVYQPLLEAPAQSIHLPGRYADLILGLAEALGLGRSAAAAARAPTGASRLARVLDAPRGLERISLDRIGADLAGHLPASAATAGAGPVHVDLPMNDPALDHAVELLAERAFAFAAWLPGWAGHDVLRMQRVADATDAELSPRLCSPQARDLMSMIRAELRP